MNWLNFFFKKNKIFIFGFLLLLFFRLPSFFESLWYGDENYYLAMAQGIVKGGEWLYVGVWDNKPPLIYILCSVSVWVFCTQLWPLRVLNFFLVFFLVFKQMLIHLKMKCKSLKDLNLNISLCYPGI